jgi:Family of unknown function (DUF6065)
LADVRIEPPRLECFAIHAEAPVIQPGASQRDWMDATDQRFAYRCLPLSIANASGWEILCPAGFEAQWDGGSGKEAIRLTALSDADRVKRFAVSHFGHGVLTMHTGYLFRTNPGWALWARGVPNRAKADLMPLEGLVETDWLAFPFTMNWRFLKPGRVRFEQGEPFCFITLAPHAQLDHVAPELKPLSADPELAEAYATQGQSRAEFIRKLSAGDPETVGQGWQKHYVRGEGLDGSAATHHVTKRRLKTPKPP